MKTTKKKVVMTTDEKVFNLCVESAKQSSNGYTFDLKAVWQAARKKYKMTKQTVLDALKVIASEHEVKMVDENTSLFSLVELMPQKKVTEQFATFKKKHPGALLLFRKNDYYIAYEEDAEKISNTIGIALKHQDGGVKVAEFPHYALDTYLPKLVRSGERVAICEQRDVRIEEARPQEPCDGTGAPTPEHLKTLREKKGSYPNTPCEIAQYNARKIARKEYGEKFVNFSFARLDNTSGKEYKNASEALRSHADMNNLLYVVKVVDGVEFTGKTRIEAYENFMVSIS